MTNKKITVTMDAEVDIEEMAERMVDEMDYQDIFDFIKHLDNEVSDWDFTLKLCEYFKEQKKIFNADYSPEEQKKVFNIDFKSKEQVFDGVWRV